MYAFAAVVESLSYSRISGHTLDDRLTEASGTNSLIISKVLNHERVCIAVEIPYRIACDAVFT